jgi:hypothetical protein
VRRQPYKARKAAALAALQAKQQGAARAARKLAAKPGRHGLLGQH